MSAKDSNRFAGLDQQRLIVFQRSELLNNCFKRCPVTRSFARASLDNQLLGSLSNVGSEIVMRQRRAAS